MVRIHQSLSSDEKDQENNQHDRHDESDANDKNEYCSSSTNEESTDESRNINDSGDEELTKEKESGKKKNSDLINKVTNRRPLKGNQNMTKANKNLKKVLVFYRCSLKSNLETK
jgi:hypothetical protein